MIDQRIVDITDLAVLGDQFPLRLMQLGFRLMQVMDDQARDAFQYILPPVVTVPPGPFLMGSAIRKDKQTSDSEWPQHTVTLAEYHIGTYPLTVAEYACFVQAVQQSEPNELITKEYGWGLAWQTQLTERAEHPVVHVSWEDVLAYTQWLAQLTGDDWRLPTEAEWEKAARGTDGRRYPWGYLWDRSRANTNDGGPHMTTPVGSYPSGASPYGAQDMAGNVWEWTSTNYKPYPYRTNDGRENMSLFANKIVRGSSWDSYPKDARVAHRSSVGSHHSKNDIGARLVCRSVA